MGFDRSSEGEDERRRRIETTEDGRSMVGIDPYTDGEDERRRRRRREDGGDAARRDSHRPFCGNSIGGGFRCFLCHGEEEKTRAKTEDRWWRIVGGFDRYRSFLSRDGEHEEETEMKKRKQI